MNYLVIKDSTSSITLKCLSTLQDYNNLTENFIITNIDGIAGLVEMRLFYWIVKGLPFTLTEIIFFCINNNLCVLIYDINNNYLTQYGACQTGKNFDMNFDENFN